jgi:hypothetical protein
MKISRNYKIDRRLLDEFDVFCRDLSLVKSSFLENMIKQGMIERRIQVKDPTVIKAPYLADVERFTGRTFAQMWAIQHGDIDPPITAVLHRPSGITQPDDQDDPEQFF